MIFLSSNEEKDVNSFNDDLIMDDFGVVEKLMADFEVEEFNIDCMRLELGDDPRDLSVEALSKILQFPSRCEFNLWEITKILRERRDPRAVKSLIAALSYDVFIQEEAAEALGEIGDPRAVKPLKEIVQNYEKNDYVREAAIRSLKKINSSSFEDPELRKRDDKKADAVDLSQIVNNWVNSSHSSRNIHNDLRFGDTGYLRDKSKHAPYDSVSRREVEDRIEKRDVAWLLKSSVITNRKGFWIFGETDKDRETKLMAFNFIVYDVGEDAIETLVPQLEHPDPKIRFRTIEALRVIGKKLRKQLVKEFKDKHKRDLMALREEVIDLYGNDWELRYEEKFHSKIFEDLYKFIYDTKDSANYEKISKRLERLNNIKRTVEHHDIRLQSGREALLKLIKNSRGEICEAAKIALDHYNLLPINVSEYIFDIDELNDYDDHDDKTKIDVHIHVHGEERSLNDQLIEENDLYMDDIISGLYRGR